MDKKYITKSYTETQALGEQFAKEILELPKNKSAVVLGLRGNLGGGKTTFLQGFAKGLGIKEKVLSPTFVIQKRFGTFYHIDCYRLENHKDILELDFKKIISNPNNIVAIEWPEKIKKVLPKNIITVDFAFVNEGKREIQFKI